MVNTRLAMYAIISIHQVKKMMIEVQNHSKYHFRAYNFQNFPGGHAPRPPRLSCYAAELRGQLLYTSVTLNLVQPGPNLPKLPWVPL